MGRMAAVVVVVAVILGAWAGSSPAEPGDNQAVGQQFGDAVAVAKAVQIVRPEQPRKETGPPGIAGKNADAAMEKYYESFRKTAPAPSTVNISIGR